MAPFIRKVPGLVFVVLIVLALVSSAYTGVQKAFYDWAPMTWWVDFIGMDLQDGPQGEQVFRLQRGNGWYGRMFDPSVPVTRYVKVQQFYKDGIRNRCVDDVMSTSDALIKPSVYFSVDEALPITCPDVSKFEGEEIYIFFAWRITLPYTVNKIKAFRLGPYRVQGGRLLAV